MKKMLQTYREKEPDRIEKRIALADRRIKAGKEQHAGVDEHEVLRRLRRKLREV
jgi:hypothetical protein